jgi:hypothetical protein
MSEDAEIKGVIPNYYNLIIDKLNKIYEAWDNNNINIALFRTLKLIPFLPRKIKNQLNPERIRIQKDLDAISQTNGFNFSNAQEKVMYKVKTISIKEFEPLIDKVTSLLDQEHLLTQNYGIPTKSRSMKDLQLTVDTARQENGE